MTWGERAAVAPLLAGIIFIGVYPQPVLSRIEPAVDHLVAHIEYADPSFRIPSQGVGHGTFAVPANQVVDMPAGHGQGHRGGHGGKPVTSPVQLAAGAGCTIDSVTAKVTGLCTGKGSITLSVSYASIMPLIVLAGGALAILLAAALMPKRRYPGLWAAVTFLIGTGTVVDGLVQWSALNTYTGVLGPGATLTLGDQIIYDHFSAFFVILFGCATALGAATSDSYLVRENLDGPEPYILMLLCSAGAVLMAQAAGFISLFLGLEILSISLYTMSAYHRRRTASGEAGLKYFILGSFSSAIFIYGAALIYGATGSTQFIEIFSFLVSNTLLHSGVLLAGMGLVIVGLGFKVAAVPFHFWSPDVYQGAPTPFVGYMAAVAKAGGFAALVRVLMLALPTEAS